MCSADALRRVCVQMGHHDHWGKGMLEEMLEDMLEELLGKCCNSWPRFKRSIEDLSPPDL